MATEHENPTPNPDEAQPPDSEPQERTYTQAEYDALKEESIRHRLRAKDADMFREALQAAALRDGTRGILHDPASLPWQEDFIGQDGLPDPEKIRVAAEALADEQPWLSRPRGDIGAGFRGENSDSVDLAGLLKAGA